MLRIVRLAVILAAAAAWAQTPPVTIRIEPNNPNNLPEAGARAFYQVLLTAQAADLPPGTPFSWDASPPLPQDLRFIQPGPVPLNQIYIRGVPTQPGTYDFFVTATSGNFAGQRSFRLIVRQPLSIVTTALPSGTAGQNYLASLEATGGFPPYGWFIEGGNPPPGLTLSSNGVLSGVPTTAGTFQFTVFVENEEGRPQPVEPVTQTYTVQINSTTPTLTITTGSPLPDATLNQPYSQTITATGGSPPYAWQLFGATLPPGLSLSPQSGALTGTPQQTGTFSFTVRVLDAAEQSATKAFQLSVRSSPAGPLEITSASPLPVATINMPYQFQFTASGGSAPYTWSAPQGVPPGFSFSETGLLSGTPTEGGTFEFRAAIIDAAKTTVSRAFALTVQSPLTITTLPNLPEGSVNSPYGFDLQAAGGVPPLRWRVVSGQLAPGLTLSEAGRLSGIPQQTGTFTFLVEVLDSIDKSASQAFSLTVVPALPPLLFSVRGMGFSAIQSGDSPSLQTFDVLSGGQALNYSLKLDGGLPGAPPPSWIRVTPLNGRTPSTVTVEVTPGVAPGVYSARIIADSPTGQELRNVVTLTVRAEPPELEVAPAFLRFAFVNPSAGPQERAVWVRNSGGGNPLSVGVAVRENTPWLSVAPATGTLDSDAPLALRVRVDVAGLSPGAYRSQFTVIAGTERLVVPVALLVLRGGPALQPELTGVRFDTIAGVTRTLARTFRILNAGTGTVNWRTEILQSSRWLTLSPTNGQATPIQPSLVRLTVDPGSLAAGAHYALIRLIDPAAENSPRYVVVVLHIRPRESVPDPELDPSGLLFLANAGGPAPAAQTVRLSAASNAPVDFRASANVLSGPAWLLVSPSTGITSAGQPADLPVSIDPAGLAPGVYTGRVSVRFSEPAVRSATVTLIVRPAGTVGPTAARPRYAAGCTPSRLAVTPTSLPQSFSSPAGWPTPIVVRLTDDCGDPVPGAQVTTTFSNGDPPLPLALSDAQAGAYSGTWTPGTARTPMNVTVTASAGSFSPARLELTGAVTANSAPVLARNGTLNNLNPVVGGPLAPGTVVQVFGQGLASSQVEPGRIPLPKTFDGTTVLVGGLEAPLYFLSSGQLNAQLPPELEAGREHSIVVATGGGYTLPDVLLTTPVDPGVAAFPDGRIIAQHQDFTLITDSSPARPGEVITMYLVGMGATDVTVPGGAPAPSDPLAWASERPTVTVDGRPATLYYAGLTPGAVGLYQINIAIPADVASGNLTVIVRQGQAEANRTVIPVRR